MFMFDGLPLHHFGVIATDCGTKFETYSPKGETSRSPQKKYTTLTDAELMQLPVGDYAGKDCFLFYWDTTARVAAGRHIPIITAWGFKPTAVAFTWFKLRKCEPAVPFFMPRQSMHFGAGLTTRKNTELCILARRGKPKRLSFGIREEIFAPVREHSRKPDEFFERAERYAAGPYLELFSRSDREGWITAGDEKGKFDV
jgi:N6-adenosine-specific RNA methylase IME4